MKTIVICIALSLVSISSALADVASFGKYFVATKKFDRYDWRANNTESFSCRSKMEEEYQLRLKQGCKISAYRDCHLLYSLSGQRHQYFGSFDYDCRR